MSEAIAGAEGQTPAKGNYLGQAWLILLLAVLYGGGLAGVQYALKDTIAANQLNETLDQIPNLVPRAQAASDRSSELGGQVPEQVFQATDSFGKPCGWVIRTSGQGFADKIEILVGTNSDLTEITGIFVLSQKETPGLGDKISHAPFAALFKQTQMPTDGSLTAVKGTPTQANEFKSITGATVSSVAVSTIINNGLSRVKPLIAQLPPLAPQKEAAQ